MIWKENYNLGVPLIDDQHKELFKRVTDFVETLRAPGVWENKVGKVNETLSFMKEYVVVHFRDEEAYQEKIGYPGFIEHKKLHADMVRYVTDTASRYEKMGFREDLAQQFAGRLLSWLINHVAATDQKIAEFVKTSGGLIR